MKYATVKESNLDWPTYHIVEVEGAELFVDEGPNWQWCMEHATFSHRDACEFILHCYDDDESHEQRMQEMRDGGCTEEFISVYNECREAGAYKVLFYC